MQSNMQVLRSQIAEVEANISTLQQKQATESVSELLQVERSLTDNRAVLARLQSALEVVKTAQEAADREKAIFVAEARKDELTRRYKALYTEVDVLRSEAVDVISTVAPQMAEKRRELRALNSEYLRLAPELDTFGLEKGLQGVVSPGPSSELTRVLDVLLSAHASGHLYIVAAVLGAPRVAQHEPSGAAETPNRDSVTPAQRLVYQRRGGSEMPVLSTRSRAAEK